MVQSGRNSCSVSKFQIEGRRIREDVVIFKRIFPSNKKKKKNCLRLHSKSGQTKAESMANDKLTSVYAFAADLLIFFFFNLHPIRYRPALRLETVSINYFYFFLFFSQRFYFFLPILCSCFVSLLTSHSVLFHSQIGLPPTKCIFSALSASFLCS